MTIYNKLLEFQKQCPSIEKTGFNPFHKSKYMKLDVILEITKPILSELGLVLSQKTKFYPVEFKGSIITSITDSETGEHLDSEIFYDISEPAQKQGANITYMRRYGLSALLGIAAEDDIDANSPEQQKAAPKPSEQAISKPNSFLKQSQANFIKGDNK